MNLPPRFVRFLLLAVWLCLLGTAPAAAQFTDTFADGDFTTNPPWSGTSDRWTIAELDGSPALRTDGAERSDTLYLSTPSAVSRGTWRFRFAYREVNLSNFNGVRVFLMADGADLSGSVRGYFVQLGTNNSDEIRLYRQDGDPASSSNRVLLAASTDALLAGEAGQLDLVVTRSEADVWSVALGGQTVLQARDTTYVQSAHFGVWVKHTQAAAQSFFFDAFDVTGDSGPADTTPPRVTAARYDDAAQGFVLTFSESIDPATATPSAFSLSDVGMPDGVVTFEDAVALLLQTPPLRSGTYSITAAGLADRAGNVLTDTTLTVAVETDEEPPALRRVEARTADSVAVAFSEPVAGCDPALYTISGGIGPPRAVAACEPDAPADTFTLVLSTPLVPGTTYTLTVRDIADARGNVLAEASASFAFFGDDGALPRPGDLVLNEINYAPPEAALEFVELLNLADRPFNLADLRFADSRGQFVPVSTSGQALEPGGYAVLVRDADAFATAFPGVEVVVPPSWPALNDTGDTVVIATDAAVLDSVAYLPRWGGQGVSLERIDPTGPANASSNWASSTDPRGGTPGSENSQFAIDLDPPRPIAVTPVEEGAALVVTFDEPLDPASLNEAVFSLVAPPDAPFVSDVAPVAQEAVRLSLTAPLATGTYTLRVQGARDLKGNRLASADLTFPYVQTSEPEPGVLVINEIMYDPAGDSGEYVELYNRSDRPFDLGDFALADNRGQATRLIGGPLQPDAYVVLVQDGAAFRSAFPGTPFLEVAPWPSLNNGGDTVVLTAAGVLVDSVAYRPSWGGDGIALERIDPSGPSATRFNWASTTDPRGGTPGARNSVFAPDLIPPRPVFAEQTEPAILTLTFDEPLAAPSVQPDVFRLDDGRTPRLTQLAEDDTVVHLRFDGPLSGTTLAVSGLRDLRGNEITSAQVLIAFQPAPGELLINEILYDPLADDEDGRPDQPEYVELVNASGRAVSLRGLYWTDAPDEDGVADTLRLGEVLQRLPAGGYAVVFAGGSDAEEPALTDAFPATPTGSPSVVLLPQPRNTLSLTNSGELIRLHRPDGTAVDAAPYDPDWHAPGLRDATGTSLERISLTAASDAPTNWTSSVAAAGGTPGQANSVALAEPTATEPDDVTIEPSPFSPDGDGFDDQTRIRYRLSAPTALLRVRIFDAHGRLVRTLEQARLAGPFGELIWDGLDDERRTLRTGLYVVLVEALDAEGGRMGRFKRTVVLARPL